MAQPQKLPDRRPEPVVEAPRVAPGRRPRLLALLVVAAIVAGVVATGAALLVNRLESRTNPQVLDLGSHVTITEESVITQVAAKAAPAVVAVVTEQSPALRFGSGFVTTVDGYVVTAADVIANSSTLTVVLGTDLSRHEARLIDADCATDIAVLKVDGVNGLPTLAFGDSTALKVGQTLIAVAAASATPNITRGIVADVHGTVLSPDAVSGRSQRQIADVIGIDASFTSSVSGAPVLNAGGQVVGLAVSAPVGATRPAFVLSQAEVQPEIETIIRDGSLTLPDLGVQTRFLDSAEAALRGTPAGDVVAAVGRGGPAELAGLQVGDVITALDEIRVDDAHPLALLLRTRFRPAQRVTVSLTRNGAATQVQATLAGAHPTC